MFPIANLLDTFIYNFLFVLHREALGIAKIRLAKWISGIGGYRIMWQKSFLIITCPPFEDVTVVRTYVYILSTSVFGYSYAYLSNLHGLRLDDLTGYPAQPERSINALVISRDGPEPDIRRVLNETKRFLQSMKYYSFHFLL